MHRLQASEDLSFFSGAYLLQVCVGRNEVIVNFDRDVSLTILSDFAVQPQGGILERFEDPLKGSGAVFTLLHDTVTLAEATAEGDLKIRFASGGSLIVFDTSSQYESFWIRHGKQEIVVQGVTSDEFYEVAGCTQSHNELARRCILAAHSESDR